jgi:ABC-type polar amino acid transport system ATPase subunit
MKIKSLKINKHFHLEDISFDFTYPLGHEKEGQPLDKICFIGQSATGKTKLLKLISETILYLLRLEIVNGTDIWMKPSNYSNDLDGKLELIFEKNSLIFTNDEVQYNNSIFKNHKGSGGTIDNLLPNHNYSNKVLYFDSNYISTENLKYFNTKPLEIVFEPRKTELNKLDEFIFDENSSDQYIIRLLKSFLDYRQKFDTKARELLLSGYISDMKKLNKEFQKWQKENPNPIDNLSEKFDLIFSKLNLEIDKINVDYPIPFKNKNTDEIIPFSGLSTGTKGLLLLLLPLYLIDTSKSIVLIDEPERSLYPDIQMELIETFKKISPKSQLIIATHSPFIASSFEPEERFILFFHEDGKVGVMRGTAPIGDDPNDILKSDFKLEHLMNVDGREAFDKYKKLKKELSEETNKKKKDKLLEELLEIGNAYKF